MSSHDLPTLKAGKLLKEAEKAIILLHGRGASAEDILSLNTYLHLGDMAILAPQASRNSWYPYSFMAPMDQNQPALDSALHIVESAVSEVLAAGIPLSRLYFAGFSQGACLTLEYVARHATLYGGVLALTGGLIGEQLQMSNYQGDFAGTPILISTGNPDPHVPLKRVEESVEVLRALNAKVSFHVFPGRPHTISKEEIDVANKLLFKSGL
ncbi:phospholipase/carboxylesterase [bacterium A37T11]|nr:phospholipase/carboxylesterase [bacterium A37T11]